jgi:hypothetical protein
MTLDQQADATGALKRLQSDAPVRSLYAQGLGTWNVWDGASAKLEVGTKFANGWTAYGAGTWDERGPGAELGVRWETRW